MVESDIVLILGPGGIIHLLCSVVHSWSPCRDGSSSWTGLVLLVTLVMVEALAAARVVLEGSHTAGGLDDYQCHPS